MTLQTAANAINGRLTGPDAVFNGVSTDTRKINPGDLFVALRGDRFDGHAFIDQARQKGAVAALVDQPVEGFPAIEVDDTLSGLQHLAAHWRSGLGIPIVAITGSNGKTTVKEMTGSILSRSAPTQVSAGNLNNHIGLPLSILGITAEHRYAVLEMGMNHAGELDKLTAIARPDIALVNNAGAAHLEGLGTVENVARAKAEIYNGLADTGIGIYNGDDPHASIWASAIGSRKAVKFGLNPGCEVSGKVVLHPNYSELRISYQEREIPVRLEVPGRHNAMNALAAASIALVLEVDDICVREGLESFRAVSGRNQEIKLAGGASLINDSYNANPASMRAAVDVLSAMQGNRFLVIGDMAELGPDAEQLHQDLGGYARDSGIENLFAFGPLSSKACAGFGHNARHFEDVAVLIEVIKKAIDADSVVLVKGSRSMRMERIVEALSVEGSH